eukprot:comp4659_c0_seq1/m.846 comp4659_c0_seq1/g.846  ORF comp4659_c0_seq1/g.846 comp4659_c0_seq1/m.846 type:complete len:227 (-) comp4659_c0_seq1:234-914(-)
MGEQLPELWSIQKGVARSIQSYGVFVAMDGYKRNGLVHVTQISNSKVDNPADVVAENEPVYVKVIGFGDDPENPKISLSMKVVNQRTGEDLDKNNVRITLDQRKTKVLPAEMQHLISEETVQNAKCNKCGCKGHLAINCFSGAGGSKYELIGEDEIEEPEPAIPTADIEGKKKKKKSKESKKERKKKDKKSKKHKKHKRSRDTSSSSSSSESGDSDSHHRRKRSRR